MKKTAILLINVGTPDKPDVKHVRKYLSQFLNDKYVIDLPWLLRKLLVNIIIVPFRAPKSSKMYQELWTKNGSPLLNHLNGLTHKLQKKLSDNYLVMGAMHYGNPTVKSALEKIKTENIENIIVVPLYPQYATSTTESAKKYVLKIIKSCGIKAEVGFIEQFYNEPSFVEAFTEQIKSYQPESYDHIVFSYHGLPVNQVQNIHPENKYSACNCENEFPEHGKRCYKATCYETSRLLAQKLSLPKEKYTVAFQSRLSNNWLEPFTDKILLELLKQGKKKVLVAAPSFVADCLETSYEIVVEYKKLFLNNGGKELVLVESLNDNETWVNSLIQIIKKSI
ncbi:Ferrochelatase [uncultured Paludibacter sp.]|uniref:Ferrochelatase n=1 Tax=uncultured Paludibacter sp. TaxID=497635 RepID=A0A653A9F7_9BACT|nr:Ferrochelatase [uncultured Paludibacter sp.]